MDDAAATIRSAFRAAQQAADHPLTLYRLCEDTGVPYNTARRFLVLGQEPSLSTAEKIAAGLGMRLELRPIRPR